jgi:predicted nucleic acid-binding protein
MAGEMQLIDTNILVHAYTVSNEKKHRAALPIVEKVWAGEEAATALQNLCEFFFVVTRKVSKPISVTAAEATVEAILASSRWRVIDKAPLQMPAYNKGNVIRGGFGSTFRLSAVLTQAGLSARAQVERIVCHADYKDRDRERRTTRPTWGKGKGDGLIFQWSQGRGDKA